MAQLAAPPDVSVWIEDYLVYLFDVVNDLPEINEEWDSWDDIEQIDFVFEWDNKRDRLSHLEQWDEQGLVTGTQAQRYCQLLDLLEQRRPIIERLLAD